ncbi:hypothetical protein AAZX31_04G029700 [Glycine max]
MITEQTTMMPISINFPWSNIKFKLMHVEIWAAKFPRCFLL